MMQNFKSRFRQTAEQAAILENNGHLAEAAAWWNDALGLASIRENQHWCAIRSQLCQNLQIISEHRTRAGAYEN